mmetsp:Transcript_17656/g.43636  ORF Transcript_17656/g.43636 Transcript_17656/m.43636 type:complete len:223 (+) Transcript_17656:115-783(+)
MSFPNMISARPNAQVRTRMAGYPAGAPQGDVDAAVCDITRMPGAHLKCALTGSHPASTCSAVAGASGSREAEPTVIANGARVFASPWGVNAASSSPSPLSKRSISVAIVNPSNAAGMAADAPPNDDSIATTSRLEPSTTRASSSSMTYKMSGSFSPVSASTTTVLLRVNVTGMRGLAANARSIASSTLTACGGDSHMHGFGPLSRATTMGSDAATTVPSGSV